MDPIPFDEGTYNQVHRGANKRDGTPVIIRRTKNKDEEEDEEEQQKQDSADSQDLQKRRHTFLQETALMQIASDKGFGPVLYSAGSCADAADPHFWQAMEPFTASLSSYMDRFSPCSGQRLDGIESSLRELFLKMAKARMFCMDLKPANVVLQFDQEGVIAKMRLIDFDNTFCLTHVQDDVSVNTLMLSMLIIFSNNTYKVCQTMFFRTFLNNVFSGVAKLPHADGKVQYKNVLAFLRHANTSEFTVCELMRHYDKAHHANRHRSKPVSLAHMVNDVLGDEQAPAAPAAPKIRAPKAQSLAGKARPSKARPSKARPLAGKARPSKARPSAGNARPSKARPLAGNARPSARK